MGYSIGVEQFVGWVPKPLKDQLIAAAYRSRQRAIRLPFLALHMALAKVMGGKSAPPPEVVKEVRERYRALMQRDIDNALEGVYPLRLLSMPSIGDHIRSVPEALRQLPATLSRAKNKNFKDLPDNAEVQGYPPYYRRNFHWQTDGYLSRRSAAVYDLQTDWVFMGAVNAMRRQVIPLIADELGARSDVSSSLLDVACGTGQTLKQLHATFPTLNLSGCDLSPFY
jgi:hypothetical protein